MIRLLTGTIEANNEKTVTILTAGGVGYLVYVPSRASYQLAETVTLHTYLAVRENALDVYGFNNPVELQWFELLLTIPKIGPKSALQIMDQATPELLAESVNLNDAAHLAKLSGIGKKTAEKIIQELAEKIPPELAFTNTTEPSGHYQDAFDTLITLGYNPNDIRFALESSTATSTSDLVKEALRKL